MGKALPFYSHPFSRYVFLQGLLCANLFLLCISSMTGPDADNTMHNRLVACNRSSVTDEECDAASRSLGKLRVNEVIIWSQHLTLGVLSCFSGAIGILAWATHTKTWPRLEKQRLVTVPGWDTVGYVALFHFLILRVVYLWFSVMATALVLWDGFHFAASLQELLPEPTQSSETPPSKREPIQPPPPLKPAEKIATVTQKTPTVAPVGRYPKTNTRMQTLFNR